MLTGEDPNAVATELGLSAAGFSLSQSTAHGRNVLRGFVREIAERKNLKGEQRRVSVLEVGSFEGASALLWSHTIAKTCGSFGSVLCVDSWRSFDEPGVKHDYAWDVMLDALKSGSAFERFLKNITHAPIPISWVRASFVEAMPFLLGKKFDIVYIDASHSYEDVLEDIRLAAPFVRSGGILCGDNFESTYSGVIQAVEESFSLGGFTHAYGIWRSLGAK